MRELHIICSAILECPSCWQNCHMDQILCEITFTPLVVPPKWPHGRPPGEDPSSVLPSLLFPLVLLLLFLFLTLQSFLLSLLPDLSLPFLLPLWPCPFPFPGSHLLLSSCRQALVLHLLLFFSPLVAALPAITSLLSSPSSSPFSCHSSFFLGWWLTSRFTLFYPN